MRENNRRTGSYERGQSKSNYTGRSNSGKNTNSERSGHSSNSSYSKSSNGERSSYAGHSKSTNSKYSSYTSQGKSSNGERDGHNSYAARNKSSKNGYSERGSRSTYSARYDQNEIRQEKARQEELWEERVRRERMDQESGYETETVMEASEMGDQPEEALDETLVEGRNAVLETFRAGRTVERLYVQEGLKDGPILSILREAGKHDTIISRVSKERLDQLSHSGAHQGVVAKTAAFEYATVEDILQKARKSGEQPFIFLLDNIEDPHNLGAIIRTANLCGAHGVIIPKRRSVGLTATAVKASAGAVNYTPVAKVTNIGTTIDQLKKEGLWFVCADMNGQRMYDLNLTGPIGLVIGSEGEGVSRLVKEKCDFAAAIPMKGNIDSLNASVAAGVLAYEIVRQRGLAK